MTLLWLTLTFLYTTSALLLKESLLKAFIYRMSTLHEENMTIRETGEESEKEPELKENLEVHKKLTTASDRLVESKVGATKISGSHTYDSLQEELQPKQAGSGSPSICVSSGYGSQAASSSNLSSEDSLSIKSISVDETPDTENNNLCSDDVSKVLLQPLHLESLLLSPPDVSLQSTTTPGEETDHTMTETTPSSTNITPSHSVELESSGDHDTLISSAPGVTRRHNINQRTLSQRLSCPGSLLLECDESSGGVSSVNDGIIRSCRRSVPDMNDNRNISTESLDDTEQSDKVNDDLPDWMKVGESVQVKLSNLSGVIAYVGTTQFANGTWVGLELDTSQGKNNGTVQGVKYFECAAKRGMFVRPKNVKLDKRGREMHLRRKLKETESFDRNHRPCSKTKTRSTNK